jgi:hypothetical protein
MTSRFGVRRRPKTSEDGTGWIYADLFLAMFVVGLGSAIVTTSAPSSGAQVPTEKTFQLSCQEFSIKLPGNVASSGPVVESEVAAEIGRRGWAPEASKPGLVIVVGGYNDNEEPRDGDSRARGILPRLRSSISLLENVEMRTSGSRSVLVEGQRYAVGGAGSYQLLVYLLYSGQQLDEDCTR